MPLDLVLDGGGVRGIALVGALSVLDEAGYRFQRVAGTSAGAMVGSLVAAGMPASGLRAAIHELDYRRFLDRSGARRLPVVGKGLSLLVAKGMYTGNYLTDWLGRRLADLGVRTFGDLRLAGDRGSGLRPEQQYRLVVTALDVTRARLVRLPWDYPSYGLDPDQQPVVDAVRASASLPFLFDPAVLRHGNGARSVLLDGGLVSYFPLDIFDRRDGRAPRWPTFGLKLSGPPPTPAPRTIAGPIGLGLALLAGLRTVYEQRAYDRLAMGDRTISIDTGPAIGRADFALDRDAQTALYLAGRRDTESFLRTWRWERHLELARLGHPVGAGIGLDGFAGLGGPELEAVLA
ncbi:MAG: patatin-like phospholipase family protein [Actinomycetota bacterium]|nr:patatin-like phospholipase family protein [Actinomycetota bacterium]